MKSIVEQAKRTYETWENIKSIEIRKVNDLLFEEMLAASDNKRYMEQRIHVYDMVDNELKLIWVEVEGEGYGWLWLSQNNNPEKWHDLIKNQLVIFINTYEGQDEQALVITTDNEIIYHIIQRDTLQRDVLYIFSDNEIDL